MTISTVNALAASARAYLARTVAPASQRSADDAAAAQRRSDDAARRREREAASSAVASSEATRGSQASRRSDEPGPVGPEAKASQSKEVPPTRARSGHSKATSNDDDSDVADEADGLDTGTLVARFFDVLQAAAKAGSAAPRARSPAQPGESADDAGADGDATTDPVAASTPSASSGTAGADAFYGPAMSMPWARTAPAQATAASGDPAAGVSVAAAASQAMSASSTRSPDGESTSKAVAEPGNPAAATASSILATGTIAAGSAPASTGSWPLFGPSATRPSVRAGTEPASRADGEIDDDGRDALDTSAFAVAAGLSKAGTDRIAASDVGAGMRDRLVASASAMTSGSAGAASNGAASALWPWPSNAVGASGSSTAVPLAAATAGEWRDTLSQALGDRLQLTLKQGAEQAVIRLDPPMLGRIDLSLRQDGALLTVHLSASNPEVLRQLQAMGDGLRQDLATRHAGELTVTVASQPSGLAAEADARQRQSRQRDDPDEATPGRALAQAEAASSDEEASPRSYASLTRSGGAA